MRTEIRHDPSFAVARCFIDRGQTINIESGAMAAQSLGIKIEAKMQGGLFGALKRTIMSGDSFFVSKFSADPNHDGWVDVAPAYPGDVAALDVPAHGLTLTRGAWLASDLDVNLDASVNPRMFLGGEGIFTVNCTGRGTVVISAYGALDVHSLGAGEGMTIDTGHLVAYENGMQVNIRKAGTGFINSLTSGEGLVMDIYGPGDVLTQTRNPTAFAGFIRSLLPSNN